ncbi:MAG: KpsF/GutQ family sugar-phosphate isomerase [Bacteroidales bacterium]|jgi:arabinose-5-phosphate isomerase
MSEQEIKKIAIKTIKQEAKSIDSLANYIDDNFIQAVYRISETEGRVIVTGIGKSAAIAQKIVSSLNSTGTHAQFLHACDALHGDLGMIGKKDTVICISRSGETPEITVLLPIIKSLGNCLITITSNLESTAAKLSDYVICSKVEKEACPNNLAPTTSSTAQLVLGDALVVALLQIKGFTVSDFAKVHPGGALGKRLYLRVSDLYVHNSKPLVLKDDDISKVIYVISSNCLGVTVVEDENNKIVGVITDGDLRRMMEKNMNFQDICAKDIMTSSPKTIRDNVLVVNALEEMRKNSITQLIVVDEVNNYLGIIHIHDIIREGIL